MRTKVLLGLAALAAGVASSMAQSNVYSLNIVGYANVPTKQGFTFESNPFDASPNNAANNVIANPDPTQDYSGPWDASNIQLWTGVGWNIMLFDSVTSDTTTGFTTLAGAPVAAPILNSGLGYLINNGQGVSNNITYVGTVRTGTNNIAYPVAAHAYAVGSPLPYAGGLSSSLGMAQAPTTDYSGPLDGSYVEFLRVNPAGQAAGYTISLFDSVTTDTTTGFTTLAGAQTPEPQVPIGGGFLFVSQGAGTYTWTQILNP